MTASLSPLPELTRLFVETAVVAGNCIMEIYAEDFEVIEKQDGSPVTLADQQADQYIFEALTAALPSLPIITEERAAEGIVPDTGKRFILVDPLDGTKEFVARRREFTVNIALIEQGIPTLGVVYAPAIGRMFYGSEKGGAFEQIEGREVPISVQQPGEDGWVLVTSRSHRSGGENDVLNGVTIRDTITAGSSLKFCLVACGEGDVYPRQGRTMEWDTAAGHAILKAAGGRVLTLDGKPLRYGKEGLDNPHFIALGGGVLPS